MAQLIKVSGLTDKEMATVFSFGLMVQDMRAYGWGIRLTETESSCTQMVTCMKENGATTRQKDKEHTRMQMAPTTRELGSMINSMDAALSRGLMARAMKAITKRAKKRARVV